MALATNTTEGTIVLSGDLTGTALSPQLRPSGVTAGTYVPADIVVDSKGRVVFAKTINLNDVLNVIGDATVSHKGVVQVGSNITVNSGIISVATATNSVLGLVKSADTNNITITSGDINVGPNIPRINQNNSFTKRNRHEMVVITPSGNVFTPNFSLSDLFSMTMTSNSTLNNPTNIRAGLFYTIIMYNNANYNLSYGSYFSFTSAPIEPVGTSVMVCFAESTTSLLCIMQQNFI